MVSNVNCFTLSPDISDKNQVIATVNTIPQLAGLTLIDNDPANLAGQVIYIDFDRAKNVAYHGPVTVNNIDVPAFTATEDVKSNIVTQLNDEFAGSGVTFTDEKPDVMTNVSTIYVGGNDSAFAGYGSFLGLSETVDSGNKIKNDNAFVFSDKFAPSQLADVITHEAGHLIGYEHTDQTATTGGVLGDYALTGNAAQLITFNTWNQDGPYNKLCPLDPTKLKRSYVGCSATATAQVLYYWKSTKAITFSADDKYVSKYSDDNKFAINIDGDSTKLDFPTLASLTTQLSSIKYDFSPDEEAALSFGVGIKLKMDYSSAESAAHISAAAFKSAFGFISAGLLSTTPATMISNAYLSVIIDNLQKGEPVITSISKTGSKGGHAVIIDGFRQSDQTFHVNMGWGGSDDGWYSLPAIPDYNQINQYLIDVFPTGKANETYTVTNTDDYGVGSLRRAIEMANDKTGVDTITFDPSMQGKTITLTSGQIQITEGLNIIGLGKDSLSISGGWSGGKAGNGSDIFYVGGEKITNINVSISGLTLTGGNSDQGGALYNMANLTLQNVAITGSKSKDFGGALCNAGTLTANGLTISGNQAANGGGIANSGTFTITNSQITGNNASRNGGGIYNQSGSFTSTNCTISNNYAKESGGGISNESTLSINNTIVADNRSNSDKDIAGNVTNNSSNNLVSDGGASKLVNNVNGNKVGSAKNPLDPGFVQAPGAGTDRVWNTADDITGNYQLLATSAAVDAGNNSLANGDTDLNGNARLYDGTADIGAYEFQGGDNVAPGTPAGLAVTVTGMSAVLDWNDDTDNSGSVKQYEVQIDRQNDFKSPEYSDYFTPSAGTQTDIPGGKYFWRVRAEDNSGNLSEWSSASSFMVVPTDTAGNTIKTAKNINDGVDNWVGAGDAADVYKLTMTHSGTVALNLTGLEADANLYLLDSKGNLLKRSANRGIMPETLNQTLAAGDYYVKIAPSDDGKGGINTYYALTHDVNYFPDDTAGNTLAAARKISAAGTVSEWLGFGDKIDLYKFELQSTTAARFDLSGLSSNVNLYLYNAKGNLLAASVKSGNAGENISRTLTAGTYYLNAALAGSNNTNYALNFGVDPSAFKVGSLQLFGSTATVLGSGGLTADDPTKKNTGMLAG